MVQWMYRDYRPVWVLSTGRAGTSFLANLLASSANLRAYHEPEPRLEYFANFAYHHQDQASLLEGMVNTARMELVLQAAVDKKIYVECNHAVTPLAPALSRLFLNARFVHLTRHPADFARSAVCMGFHKSDTVWETGRIRMESEEEWERLSHLQKLGWYWQATGNFIEQFGQQLDPQRFLRIGYEQLVRGEEGLARLLDFVGGDPISGIEIAALQGTKINTVKLGRASTLKRTLHYAVPRCWTRSQCDQLKPYAEELCNKLGYTLPETLEQDLPLLSVVIPNYNCAQYLRQCLDSVLAQTYTELEILVVDDASTDDSSTLLAEYEANFPEKVRVLRLTQNGGVSHARNFGIQEARGLYLTTLDSDDFFLDRNKLSAEVNLVLWHKQRNGVDVIGYSDVLLTDEFGEIRPDQYFEGPIQEGDLLHGILTRSCFVPRDFVALRSAYQECGGYDPTLSTHEDWNLKIKLAARHAYHYTGLAGIAYRRHGQGLSSAPLWQRVENMARVFRSNLELFVSDPGVKTQLCETFTTLMDSLKPSRFYSDDPTGAHENAMEMYRHAAEQRLELIHKLESVCQERLALINSLQSICQQRQEQIERMRQKNPLGWMRRFI